MKLLTNILHILFLLMIVVSIQAQQLPDIMPKTPTVGTLGNYTNLYGQTNIAPSAYVPMSQHQQNAMLRAEADQHIAQAQQAEQKRRVEVLINEAVAHFSTPYNLPSYANEKGTSQYRDAFDLLKKMEDSIFSLKKAVFTVENAFKENQKDYESFNKVIRETGMFIKEKMQEFGYDPKSNVAKNLILFRFFSDTLQISSNGRNHLPLNYDFDDHKGQKDWSKMFVTKLLEAGSGQCHSLPLLYLILAEEIGAEAYLSNAPNHTYIKFPDDNKRKWHNIELTSHILTTNAHILQTGYIKAEAIQHKLYLHPLNEKELLAHMYTDLAMGYERKYGNDHFMDEVTQQALELHPTSITAHLNRANYYNEMVKHVFEQLGITRENANTELPKYPSALKLFQTMVKQHKTIDAMGYKKMPDEMYQAWLSKMQEQKDNQEQQQMKQQLQKLTKPVTKL